jgi:hypothetical protein
MTEIIYIPRRVPTVEECLRATLGRSGFEEILACIVETTQVTHGNEISVQDFDRHWPIITGFMPSYALGRLLLADEGEVRRDPVFYRLLACFVYQLFINE